MILLFHFSKFGLLKDLITNVQAIKIWNFMSVPHLSNAKFQRKMKGRLELTQPDICITVC